MSLLPLPPVDQCHAYFCRMNSFAILKKFWHTCPWQVKEMAMEKWCWALQPVSLEKVISFSVCLAFLPCPHFKKCYFATTWGGNIWDYSSCGGEDSLVRTLTALIAVSRIPRFKHFTCHLNAISQNCLLYLLVKEVILTYWRILFRVIFIHIT